MESSTSANTHMLRNTNKTNKTFFAGFASSLLAVNLGMGSGFFVNSKGYIVTNVRVIEATVIKIEIKNAAVLKLGDSEQVITQDKIFAIAYPGINPDILDSQSFAEATITSGKISVKKRLAHG